MGFKDQLMRLLGRDGGSALKADEPDALVDKLNEMRGDNITVVDSAGTIAPNRDGMENLAAAARDARIVNMAAEDDRLSEMKSYRRTS